VLFHLSALYFLRIWHSFLTAVIYAEGANGYAVKQEFFDVVKMIGMTHIRLPVSFTYHTDATSPYTIDEIFLQRLDEIIAMAIDTNEIKVILDQHHYDDFQADPVEQWPRALAIWEQLATRYAGRDDSMLYFEIQNEPHDAFNADPSLLNSYLDSALSVIRETNPTRKVLVGPNQWNGLSGLKGLVLPNDPNLILTMHYYTPGDFTHQGAEWIPNAPAAGSIDWNPNAVKMWWWDYSWGLEKSISKARGWSVKFNAGWSMLSLYQPGGFESVAKAIITTNSTIDVKLGFKVSNGKKPDGSWNFLSSSTFNTGIGINGHVLAMPPNLGTVSEIHLQNLSPNGQREAIFLNEYHLLLEDGTKIPTFVTSAESIYLDLARMVRWGNQHGLPVHLGEFGAYNKAPPLARTNWTKSVRQAADTLGMDWSYWELAAGFGFWDANKHTWKDSALKDALVKD